MVPRASLRYVDPVRTSRNHSSSSRFAIRPSDIGCALFLFLVVVGVVTPSFAQSRSKGQCRSAEVLDCLSKRLSTKDPSVQGAFTHARHPDSRDGEARAEFHASSMPVMNPGKFTRTAILPGMSNHPVGNSLIELIDRTPEGAVIRVAVYIFDNQEVQDALVRAIRRGVVVQLLTTDEGARAAEILTQALRESQVGSASADDTDIDRRDRPQRSSIKLCGNKFGDSPGGCLGVHLLHHKFATFSRVCRYGMEGNRCVDGPKSSEPRVYRWVVYQSSWNFTGLAKHNISSAFLGYRDMYRAYRRHFFLMNTQVPVTSIDSTPVDILGSTVNVQFTPKWRDSSTEESYRQTDLFLRELADVKCARQGRTSLIRIANTHWGRPVADDVVTRVKELVRMGCRVQVLLPADMAASPVRQAAPKRQSVSREDSRIFNDLVATGADVRSFAYAPNVGDSASMGPGDALPNLHAKYVLVDDPRGRSFSKLMFGTLSFTWSSQEFNDEAWLVWNNPSSVAHRFYGEAFDKLFTRLPSGGQN